jgi:UDPglucose--hexose-1-phosphate uridylyltransferase
MALTMTKYVPDISSRRWVIVSPRRTLRPEDTSNMRTEKVCVFCPGNEQMTDPEVYRIGEGEKDQSGWKVRVIPNRYPITDFHEVIIHTPEDSLDLDTMPTGDIGLIFQAYKNRYLHYKDRGKVLIFCNHGEHAGASIKHAHSQLVVIPYQIRLDTLLREPIHNIVEETEYFTVYCPEFSQWPYEVWIAPKKEGTVFGDITDAEITELANLMQKLLVRIKNLYKQGGDWLTVDFGYNYYIHPLENWYLRFIPRFVHRAGFELGTGLSVNIIDPADAALELKGESVHVK